MISYFPVPDPKDRQIIDSLCVTAVKGLTDCYSREDFFEPGRDINESQSQLTEVSNLRYIIIAQIGIKRWLRYSDGDVSLPDLWEQIWSRRHEIITAGDLGLAIWAGVESNASEYKFFTEELVKNWSRLHKLCNAVELAWVVHGLVRFRQNQRMTNDTIRILRNAHARLINLYCRNTKLFARHHRAGLNQAISRRVACFADQVYPILALADYGRYCNDSASLDTAAAVADTLCRFQGAKGQWWWHYDVKTGVVAEEYPVFSVHQDGMAPMALLAIDEAAGTDHSCYIQKGLNWLNEDNELSEKMIIPDRGIIYRDIRRREIGKVYRMARGALITAGLNTMHRLLGRNLSGFSVNRQCRPYHLGWILYAWAGRVPKTNEAANDTRCKAAQISSFSQEQI